MALPQARHGRPRLLRVPLHPDPGQHRKAQGLRAEIQPKRAKQQERSVESIALERRVKREEESGEGEAGTTRALPNGLMTIATAPPVGGCRDEGGTVDRRVGFEEGCLLTRRSLLILLAHSLLCVLCSCLALTLFCSSLLLRLCGFQKIPCGRGSAMGRKRACHSCKVRKVVNMVRCLSCRKRFFCSCCIEKGYSPRSLASVYSWIPH
ncbi:hypothetical protein ZIOFF_011168 [Zingiber officinale]|uniref:Uncharacterized protein n=1 Tax=Zingiber officinale TaxID=94328 RepID=A0A8J5LKI8_ZINOF|nr:hypothetical protein ZIOFF_011168 [Zingiber officinale]